MKRQFLVTAVLAAALAACGGEEQAGVSGPPPSAPDRIELRSPAFADGAAIPERYTCEGDQTSPPLEWRAVPSGAKELALLVEDPDAPSGTFVHWTLYGLPPSTSRIAEGQVPPGAKQGANSFGEQRYAGPCPPIDDDPHRYVFTLYALARPLGLDQGASADEVRKAIAQAKPLARGRLTGRFGRD